MNEAALGSGCIVKAGDRYLPGVHCKVSPLVCCRIYWCKHLKMLLFLFFSLEKPQGKQEQGKTASETCGCDLNLALGRAGKVSQVDICRKEPGMGITGEGN